MAKKLICVAVMVLLPVSILASNYGKISGTVTDKNTGQPLAGANVFIEGQPLGAATDEDGLYVILQVPPGVYDVQMNYVGYRIVKIEKVKVRANRIAYAMFETTESIMETEGVEVIGTRPFVEKDVTATARSVQSEDMNILPVTSVSDVLRAQPGVVSSGGLHFRGGRSGEVVYYMDGIPMVNPLFSEIRSSEVINRNAISEMQIISGTYSAEYGNAMSGIINITTKEGDNQFQYDLDVKSSAAGIETNSVDHNRYVMRGNISGPLVPEKTYFFVSGNYDDRDNYLPFGFRREYNIFAKITDRHLQDIKINASFNLSDGERQNYRHAWKYIPDQYWVQPNTSSRMVQLGLTHTLARNLFYNLKAYYNQYHYDSGDYDYRDLTPAYALDANNEFYTQNFVNSFEENDQYTVAFKGDVLWQANNHNEIKAGFEYRQHVIERFYISSPYNDDHIQDDYKTEPYEAAAYIQDKINFSSIILSAGFRFDLTAPNSDYWPSPFDVFYGLNNRKKSSEVHTQFSPRLGISYPVSENTVFHFGYGHYFQRPEYQFIYKGLADADYDGNMIMNLRSGNGRFGNPDLKPEKTIAYEFGLSHQLFDAYLLNVSVYSKKITQLTGARTFFAGDSSATGENYWETFSLHINEDFAYNNGFEIQLRKTGGTNLFGEINYTYAVAEGSSSRPLERVGSEEANRHSLRFFPLDFDQRHSINASLTYQFNKSEGPSLGGWHILENVRSSLLFRYGSGLPYTKGIRGATEEYEVNNARLPDNWTIDLKIEKDIPLGQFSIRPYLEIYNLTDRENVVYVDPFSGEPDFIEGRTTEWAANPLNWGPPRLIYLGFRLVY